MSFEQVRRGARLRGGGHCTATGVVQEQNSVHRHREDRALTAESDREVPKRPPLGYGATGHRLPLRVKGADHEMSLRPNSSSPFQSPITPRAFDSRPGSPAARRDKVPKRMASQSHTCCIRALFLRVWGDLEGEFGAKPFGGKQKTWSDPLAYRSNTTSSATTAWSISQAIPPARDGFSLEPPESLRSSPTQ